MIRATAKIGQTQHKTGSAANEMRFPPIKFGSREGQNVEQTGFGISWDLAESHAEQKISRRFSDRRAG
jgi:hypothetical protein